MVFSLLGKGSFSLVNSQSIFNISYFYVVLFDLILNVLYFFILEKRKYLSLIDCLTRQHNALPLPPLHIRGQNIGNY